MTSVEAIEILKERRMCAAYVDSEYVDIVDIEAIDIAISALEKQAQEKPLTVLSCGDDVTPIKCTGLNCPMQAGKVDPATCKAADTCKWATKPMTNADSIRDSIRQMTDEELSNLLSTVQSSIALNVVNALQPFFGKACYDNAIKQVRDRSTQNQREWLDWLKQEVSDNG